MRALAAVPSAWPADRVAMVHGGARWTFGELDARARALAALLRARGVEADDLVAFQLPNGFEFIALTFGIYLAGATPAPLSPRLATSELAEILAVMRPRAVIGADDRPASSGPGELGTHVAAAWKACTSGGSTGRPKVIVDARPAGFVDGSEFIGIPEDGAVFVPGPLYHNASFSAAVFALWRGATLVTMDRFDASDALDIIARERVRWAMMVPTMMHRIMAVPEAARARYDLSAWDMVVHTAAPMAPWLKHAWIDWLGPDHIWEVYGATEGLVRCWIGGREWLERVGSVGRPIGGGRLRILDEALRDVPPGSIGEVFAMPPTGPGSTYRYIGGERRATPDGWESVGDCGLLDGDGYLYLADRRSDLIISGGINIWPAEVEAALMRMAGVRSVAVFGVPHEDLGSAVHAVIEADFALTLPDVTSFLVPHLSRTKWPRSIAISARPVRDDAGKFRKPKGVATP